MPQSAPYLQGLEYANCTPPQQWVTPNTEKGVF